MHNTVEAKSYREILSEHMKGMKPYRIFTLGLIPTMMRNVTLFFGFVPAVAGFTDAPLSILYGLGGILLSHPFEVARVMIQYQDKQSVFGSSTKIIRGIFATEGLAGLYRGAVPRTINILPAICASALYSESIHNING